jgi:hypothetical protein
MKEKKEEGKWVTVTVGGRPLKIILESAGGVKNNRISRID